MRWNDALELVSCLIMKITRFVGYSMLSYSTFSPYLNDYREKLKQQMKMKMMITIKQTRRRKGNQRRKARRSDL